MQPLMHDTKLHQELSCGDFSATLAPQMPEEEFLRVAH